MPFFDVQQRVWWGNWYWHSVINMWLFFTDNFLFYCYYFKEIEKKDETKARAMRAFSPSFWFQKLLKYGRVCLKVAKLIFVKKRHKKTISGELHEGKKVYESWEIFIQHHTIYLKLKRVLFNEASSTPRPPPTHTQWSWWGSYERFGLREKRASNDGRISGIVSATRTGAGACSDY